MPVPFIGRLNLAEYAALVASFLLVGLEAFIRIFTLALPPWLLELFYGISRRLFNRLTSPQQKRAEQRRKSISSSIRNASDFVDLCATFGYTAEEHVVQTEDGYLLGLHRLAWRKGEEMTKVNSGPRSVKKRVVYLHHGLLMNSEVWVCLTDEHRALPFVLVERGFDVWLGNNRGNKYSKKSIRYSPHSLEFWNFSIDEFAFHDIPDSISYILETTGQQSLSYIGFSQGTAQAFASLAVHPKLNDQVNVFIALAPAMSPAGLSNGVVDTLVKASPQVLFLLFGRRSILSSAAMWESLLYPPLFTKLIDLGLSFLFNWRTQNISTSQKLAAYPHLYSFTSTKSVVHWFQIIRTKSFQMYDDDVHPPIITPLSSSTSKRYTKVARYPTRNIKTPIVLVYGGSDSLVDIKAMLKELPSQTVANEVPHYEHLDFLWARDVAEMVFDHVFDALESFTGAEHTKEEYERYRIKRETSSLGTGKGVGIGVGARRGKGLLLELHQQPHGRGHTRGLSSDINDSDVSTAVEGGSNNDEEGDGGAVEGVSAAGPGAETGTVQQQQQQQAAGRGLTASPTPSVLQQQQFRDRHETRIPSPTSGRFGIARPRSARSSLSSLPDEFVGPAAVAAQIQAYTQTHPGQGSGTNPPGQQHHMVTAPPVSPPSSRHGPPAQQKTMRFGEAAAVSVPASRGRSASVGAASTISGGSDLAVAVGAGAGVGVGAGHGGSGGGLTTPHTTAVTPPPKRRGTAGGSQIALSESLRGGRGISLGASKAVGGVTTSGAEAGLTSPGGTARAGSPEEVKGSPLRRSQVVKK